FNDGGRVIFFLICVSQKRGGGNSIPVITGITGNKKRVVSDTGGYALLEQEDPYIVNSIGQNKMNNLAVCHKVGY
ncbi:hypothetical protein, partial [Morganella morganii]|uniref:hypothetical protein n=1 Tax=Morganella morganii TaxID=582 RepID=UPI001C7175FE